MDQFGGIALVLVGVVEGGLAHYNLCVVEELELQLFIPVPVSESSDVVLDQLLQDVDVVD